MTKASIRDASLAFLVYLFAAALFTWPLLLHPASRLTAPMGAGDPYLNLWILGWDLQTISSHPLALLSGRIFDANIFHPAEQTLAYSDHLILQALFLWPVFAISHNLVLCYNLLLLASLVACGLAMHAFVHAVTGSRLGAFVAGLAWALWPFHFAHLIHIQLQALYFLPLAFLYLHRVMARGRWADAGALGAMAGLQAVASVYLGLIGAVGLVCAAAGLAIGIGRWRNTRLLRRLAVAGVVGAVVMAPFIWPYWQVQQREGFARNLYEAGQHSATLRSYLRVPPVNLVYGRTGLLRGDGSPASSESRGDDPERELFPGFTILALAVFGVWRSRRRDSWPLALSLIAAGAVGLVLSLGPDGFRSVYSALHRTVFGFQAIRSPARFGVLVMFALAGLAAVGMRELGAYALPCPHAANAHRRSFFRRAFPAFAIGLMLAEFLSVPLPVVAAPPRQAATGEWLRSAPGAGAVLYLPLQLDYENTPFMVASLEHGRPIVNGYSGQRPAFFLALVETMARFPSAESLWTLKDLGVQYVVSPEPVKMTGEGRAGSVARGLDSTPTPLVERAALDGSFVYELCWTPGIEAALPRSEAPVPQPPGQVPFAIGESAVYRVAWLGAAAAPGLSAGTATFRVEGPLPPAEGGQGTPEPPEAGGMSDLAYRLALTVETAPWVSRIFEARDRFETWTDSLLLPRRYEQHLREGRRQLDRIAVFDQTQQSVRIADDLSLPMPRGSRDPVSAFYYIRSLSLEPGARVRIPVNDGGRNLVLEVFASRVEAVSHGGQIVMALRLEPRLIQRIERRRPIDSTIWLSTDWRRIPLVVEVSAGFGAFRAELVSYAAR